MSSTFHEFLGEFAREAGIDPREADEQWAGFSRQLSDPAREAIEAGGEASGREMGADFRSLYGER